MQLKKDDWENLNELASLASQVKAAGLQDRLGKRKFHEDMKKAFELVTVTKTKTETSNNNNKAIENLNNKLLEIMNDRGILAGYVMYPLSKITNSENTTEFRFVKDSSSYTVNDSLIHNTIPITLYNNLLTFRDTCKEFELKGDFLKMITNKNYNVDLASLQDKKLLYDFAKEMIFDIKSRGKKSTRGRTFIKLLKSPGLMVSASGVSKTIIFFIRS